jgi:hypothetical protein
MAICRPANWAHMECMMSERLIRFSITELETVRICCKGKHSSGQRCSAVFEFPIKDLDSAFQGSLAPACPFCNTDFHLMAADGVATSPFLLLSRLAKVADALKTKTDLQFVIVESGESKGKKT